MDRTFVDVDLSKLFVRNLGIVPQTTISYSSGTVLDNIRYGNPAASSR